MGFAFGLTRFDFRRLAFVAGDEAAWDCAGFFKQRSIFIHGAQTTRAQTVDVAAHAPHLQVHMLECFRFDVGMADLLRILCAAAAGVTEFGHRS